MAQDDRAALSGFAAQVAALKRSREEQLPVRVGVMVATYNRPDLLRSCVLQLAHQSRAPDVICVHQNGSPESYQWAVADLTVQPRIIWLHTPQQLKQHDWYTIPLRRLLDDRCTHFFWADHDDLYLHRHVELGLKDLEAHDFSVSVRTGLLYTAPSKFQYTPQIHFTSHAPGGMSSSMCFRRAFAAELLADLARDEYRTQYTDNVVAQVTMKKFDCNVSTERNTFIYHSHAGSVTSSQWVEGVLR